MRISNGLRQLAEIASFFLYIECKNVSDPRTQDTLRTLIVHSNYFWSSSSC